MKKTIFIEDLKYPIGGYKKPESITSDQIKNWITQIEQFPSRLNTLIDDISKVELNWKYRPDGWTIQQVIHHCADSHMNSFIRFKLSLTEDTPTIKPYHEEKWAEMVDSTTTDISQSIKILDGLHSRWITMLNSLNSDDLKKEFIHPEHNIRFSIGATIALYAWHSNHHLAHIKQARKYKGNFTNINIRKKENEKG
jgi:hypothetical protein